MPLRSSHIALVHRLRAYIHLGSWQPDVPYTHNITDLLDTTGSWQPWCSITPALHLTSLFFSPLLPALSSLSLLLMRLCPVISYHPAILLTMLAFTQSVLLHNIIHIRFSHLMAGLMITLCHLLAFVPTAGGFLFHRGPIVSPTQNVHVDVVNYIASSLYSHAHDFHYNCRDFAIILIALTIGCSTCCLFCGLTAFWFHRRVLRRLADPSIPPTHLTGTHTSRHLT